MKSIRIFYLFSFLSMSIIFAQTPNRGPKMIIPSLGVVDGVVMPDEVPLRSKVEYEYVRSSDYVWSKRVFSRIDPRELINHPIFFPVDFFDLNYDPLNPKVTFSSSKNGSVDFSANENWVRNEKRLSLWTIIHQHVLSGDLTVFMPYSEFFPDLEDGYSLKYPILRGNYYTDKNFQSVIRPFLSVTGDSTEITYDIANKDGSQIKDVPLTKDGSKTLSQFVKEDGNDMLLTRYQANPSLFQTLWDKTPDKSAVKEPGGSIWIASNSIKSYYIKEDWYFDKERSVLDKRIIAIAPVIHYQVSPANDGRRFIPIVYNEKDEPFSKVSSVVNGSPVSEFKLYSGPIEERPLFWLYFDELRDVLVNYYVYNEKNDAQWMSFDDLFWKRKFSSTIYKVSDKFDRDIEDYKFGVEALYESERVKESIRNWEQDLWNY